MWRICAIKHKSHKETFFLGVNRDLGYDPGIRSFLVSVIVSTQSVGRCCAFPINSSHPAVNEPFFNLLRDKRVPVPMCVEAWRQR